MDFMNRLYICIHCRTVEINNTDAEGRLVLGDGVSLILHIQVHHFVMHGTVHLAVKL